MCCAVREARVVHPPFFGFVGERQITLIPEDIVGHLVTVQLIQDLQSPLIVSGLAYGVHLYLVIKIDDCFWIAIGDEDVLVSVIVIIAKEGTPAPIRVGDTRHAGNFTEDDVPVSRDSVIQLQ